MDKKTMSVLLVVCILTIVVLAWRSIVLQEQYDDLAKRVPNLVALTEHPESGNSPDRPTLQSTPDHQEPKVPQAEVVKKDDTSQSAQPPQDETGSNPIPKTPTLTPPASQNTGLAVAPVVARDADCARDYANAFLAGGLELRKRLVELEQYHCIDSSAAGIYRATILETRDITPTATFDRVELIYDRNLTSQALGHAPAHQNEPPHTVYVGWIPEADFVLTFDEARERASTKR
jgi:hypothetical protein